MTATMTNQEQHSQNGTVAHEAPRPSRTYIPRIDIWESGDELIVYADVPGVVAENVDIQFENGELTIHGKVSPRQENVNFLYGEYGTGDFYRTFSIGEMIDADKVVAELNNGVLVLHLPKAEQVKPRRIEVKSA